MDKKTYRVTRADIEWIAGRRVQADEPILLTDREAEPELARGHIELVEPAGKTRKARED